ncbi:protein-L-isoaspartate(D-aspartate) O-methyltransferase [Calycomorphotria hydatis]|nr:protein-L-isoaspartate(D-aspartate) O-methyltransferase [Calycomorphotria hydatis]
MLLSFNLTNAFAADPFEARRHEMVEKFIVAEGVSNSRVLEAMRAVPRHLFVRTTNLREAYFDLPLPIGYRQTISPPFIVAYMTESIDPQPEDKVLEIGTGSGYQAAVLSGLVKEVNTIEIVEPLSRNATRLLKKLNYDNVHTRAGDGYLGWPEAAPFDKIIVTCSPEKVPEPLVRQLAEGGTMIIPLGERYQQVFHLLKKENGKLVAQKLIPTLFVPMTGKSEELRSVLPTPDKPVVVNGGFELDENEDGKVDHWHYQRNATMQGESVHTGEWALRLENSTPRELSQVLQGQAIDGREVAGLRISVAARGENVTGGFDRKSRPGVVVYFYDSVRKRIGEVLIGPMVDSFSWETFGKSFPVPADAREMILCVTLNGGTGTLDVDDIQLTPISR